MIVCLGWGSLIWRPEKLALKDPVTWYSDGPALPVEFARKSRESRLITLVLVEHGPAVPVLWSEMAIDNLDAARRDLAAREHTPRIDRIGCWPSAESFPHVETIAAWGRAKGIDGVVWTALGPRFDADGEIASAEEIVAYLRSLAGNTKTSAEEYVRRAPPQIRTPNRAIIERELGWTPVGSGKGCLGRLLP
jgi:hypothetical protein